MSQDLFWVFTHVYNEEKMLPFFLRHYLKFADRIVAFVDPATNDNTREILSEAGPRVVQKPLPLANFDDGALVLFANQQVAFAESLYAAWPDVDEFLWHPNMQQRLADYAKFDLKVIRPRNAWIMSHDFMPDGPGQIYEYCRTGRSERQFEKPIIVQPKAGVIWEAGKHRTLDKNPIVSDTEMWMLHYRYMGLAWQLERNHRNWARIPESARKAGYGHQTSPDNDRADTVSFNIRRRDDQRLPDDVAI